MGSETTTRTFCDRCNKTLTEKAYYGELGTFRIEAHSDYAVAGHTDFSWKELCRECNSYVGDLITRIKGEQRNAE